MLSGELLQTVIDNAHPRLESLDEHFVSRAQKGKWSRKQILGHLIDSAAVNHRRFLIAQDQDHLVFEGYDQDAWVERQKYADRLWSDLVNLWYASNAHMAFVMDCIPEKIRREVYKKHNFDVIAMRAVPKYTATTLEYLMRDYIWHLEHHLVQILPDYDRRQHW